MRPFDALHDANRTMVQGGARVIGSYDLSRMLTSPSITGSHVPRPNDYHSQPGSTTLYRSKQTRVSIYRPVRRDLLPRATKYSPTARLGLLSGFQDRRSHSTHHDPQSTFRLLPFLRFIFSLASHNFSFTVAYRCVRKDGI